MTIAEAKRITRMNKWRRLIHERQQSGQSVRTWCLQNGIRENSYYYWLRIIREEALREAEHKSGALVRVADILQLFVITELGGSFSQFLSKFYILSNQPVTLFSIFTPVDFLLCVCTLFLQSSIE